MDKKKDRRITECMNVVSTLSYEKNSDGDGYFTEKLKIHKSEDKLIYKGSHWFIVAHQRLATSGKIPEMVQPLESKNFLFAHNGVFRNVDEKTHKESDSWAYLTKVEEAYAKTGNTVKAIQNVNNNTSGSYSCVIYNKKTHEFYYFKETASNMYIAKNEKYKLMSTKRDNVEYMVKFFGLNETVQTMPDNIIIDLTKDASKEALLKVGEFEKYVPKIEYKNNWGTTTDYYKNYWKRRAEAYNRKSKKPNNMSGSDASNFAELFKKELKNYNGLKVRTSIGIGDNNTYMLLISVDNELFDRFKDTFFNDYEVVAVHNRKRIVSMPIPRANEHMSSWDAVKQFFSDQVPKLPGNRAKCIEDRLNEEAEKMDMSPKEIEQRRFELEEEDDWWNGAAIDHV